MSIESIKALVRDIPDFPKPGINFKDITPMLADPMAFIGTIDLLAECVKLRGADEIVGIESRGFIFGAALATKLELPFQLVRKPGKLPYQTVGVEYDLEYGSDKVEMHVDAVRAGKRYAVVDDLIATGGTAAAAVQLIRQQGGVVACCAFVIELSFLEGVKKLGDVPIDTLITY
jgi:adenine phosphoribosyltransferase